MVTAARRPWSAAGLAVLLLAAGAGARAEDVASRAALSEHQVKAAYLYYFSTFVIWPDATFDRTDNALVIGVLGVDPFGKTLDDTLAGKTVNNRRIVVHRYGNLKDARDSHILFISDSERDRLSTILKTLDGVPVLTVGDGAGFATRGGQIAFRTEESKVRFDINVSAVERSHLRVSAQLMKLGHIVESPGPLGG